MTLLYYDLYALILEKLEEGDDIYTLAHCALVCRDFSNIVKRLLYQTIRLFPSRNASRVCAALYTSLSAHPHLAKSIQNLHLRDLSYAEGCGLRNWMALDQKLHLLLQVLQPHIRSLSVEGIGRLQCRYFAPGLRDAFRFVFQGPSLEEVRLSNLDQFPILPFHSLGRNVKRLAMWSLVLTEPDFYELQSIPLPLRLLTESATPEIGTNHEPSRPWIQLESLMVYCHGLERLLFDMVQKHVDFSKMKKLCLIPASSQDIESMQSWVTSSSSSLEHLTISPWPSCTYHCLYTSALCVELITTIP
ncbi:hypothetical protein BDN72DRAFT_259265 [Pluteus cervinus]|uniref:Uncharacterized protein n=1 Tax=Pluteus cervinus TaxID=181527 RepID=A0ACD3B5Z2_9AGAR|nr:hypothetical protein BDN72DRAFT_259265 [Pluteus cervinus]